MSIIEAVRSFLRTCPLLAGERLNVDFLPEEAKTYSIDVVPCRAILEEYIDGSSLRQFLFVISSREFHGQELKTNVGNLAFYEQLGDWMEAQSRATILPAMAFGKRADKIEVLTSGYALTQKPHDIKFNAAWSMARQNRREHEENQEKPVQNVYRHHTHRGVIYL